MTAVRMDRLFFGRTFFLSLDLSTQLTEALGVPLCGAWTT